MATRQGGLNVNTADHPNRLQESNLISPEVRLIAESLRSGYRDDTVILFVPSHDRSDPPREITDQDMWANEALQLFGRLYKGATAFRQLTGIWNDGVNKPLPDRPIMIQSLAKRASVENIANLEELVAFAKRMGKALNQACVGLVFNDVFHEITDFSGE